MSVPGGYEGRSTPGPLSWVFLGSWGHQSGATPLPRVFLSLSESLPCSPAWSGTTSLWLYSQPCSAQGHVHRPWVAVSFGGGAIVPLSSVIESRVSRGMVAPGRHLLRGATPPCGCSPSTCWSWKVSSTSHVLGGPGCTPALLTPCPRASPCNALGRRENAICSRPEAPGSSRLHGWPAKAEPWRKRLGGS